MQTPWAAGVRACVLGGLGLGSTLVDWGANRQRWPQVGRRRGIDEGLGLHPADVAWVGTFRVRVRVRVSCSPSSIGGGGRCCGAAARGGAAVVRGWVVIGRRDGGGNTGWGCGLGLSAAWGWACETYLGWSGGAAAL